MAERRTDELETRSREEVFAEADAVIDRLAEAAETARDPSMRTHQIVLGYSLIAAQIDRRLFGDGDQIVQGRIRPENVVNANWFHFATWGTATVSRNIRNERAPQRLDGLSQPIRRLVAPYLIRARAGNQQLIGQALAAGQLQMFRNVVAVYRKVRDRLESETEITAKLPKSDSKPDWDAGYNELLAKGFEWLRLAGVAHRLRGAGSAWGDEAIDQAVARLVLGSSVVLTLVEQHLVNEAIRLVIDSVPERAVADVSRRAGRMAERLGEPRTLAEIEVYNRTTPVAALVTDLWARFMTRQVLMIVLPTEALRVGRDAPPRLAAPLYPPQLRQLDVFTSDDQPVPQRAAQVLPKAIARALADAFDYVTAYSRATEGGRGSAAHDWRHLGDRMNWAVSLFRSRQQDRSMFWPPYGSEDRAAISEGRHPRLLGDPDAFEVYPPTPGGVTRVVDPLAGVASRFQSRAGG